MIPSRFLGHLDTDGRRLYIGLNVNFALFGVTMTLIGATLPRLIRAFDWSYTVSGLVLSAGSLGYFVTTFVVGLLIHRLGARRVMLAGLALEALGLLLFARHPSPGVNMGLSFLIGIGHGCAEVVTNLSVIRMEREGSSRMMNLAHAVFCVGGVLGPLAVGGWLGLTPLDSDPWRAVYPATGALVILMLLLLLRVRYPAEEPEHVAAAARPSTGRSPLLAIFAVMLFLYVSGEIGFSNWASEYFVEARSMAISLGALMVSALWLGILAGRLGLSLWYTGVRQDLVIIGLSLVSALSVVFVISVRSVGLAVLGVFAAGLGYSGVYPMVMTLVGRWFRSGRAVGIVSTGGGMGSFAFPFLMGYLGERLGIATAFLLCAALAFLLALLAVMVTVVRPRDRKASAPSSTA